MIHVAVVGYGLAGRVFHCPLVARQPSMVLKGIVARAPEIRAEAVARWGVQGYASIDEALADPSIDLVVLATPHDTHADLTIRTLAAGKPCVVDKVMALSESEADAMIGARDRSGKMLSVFHNRRWDWDYLTVRSVLDQGLLGQVSLIESAVCQYRPPRGWRADTTSAGTILHDWGAHLIDQALQLGRVRKLSAWLLPGPWPGSTSGGHGRVTMHFEDGRIFVAEVSRACWLERPRWSILGSDGGLVQYGIDPQEDALRRGDLGSADQPDSHRVRLRIGSADGTASESAVETVRGSWDRYYANIADHLLTGAPLEVTAEQGREVVRVLDAALRAAHDGVTVSGPWG